jgi:hypothetical protein
VDVGGLPLKGRASFSEAQHPLYQIEIESEFSDSQMTVHYFECFNVSFLVS